MCQHILMLDNKVASVTHVYPCYTLLDNEISIMDEILRQVVRE
jgi:hypothetical protein